MTNEPIVALARQIDYMQAELRNLLQRAASALEAPDYLNEHERSQLVEDLFAATMERSIASR
jgi:hypothetical protein